MNTYPDRYGRPINVFEYPYLAWGEQLRDYQLAVEIAHIRDGMVVELGIRGEHPRWIELVRVRQFLWEICIYRIAKPKPPIDDDEKMIREVYGWNDGRSNQMITTSYHHIISMSKKLLVLDRINRPRVIDEE